MRERFLQPGYTRVTLSRPSWTYYAEQLIDRATPEDLRRIADAVGLSGTSDAALPDCVRARAAFLRIDDGDVVSTWPRMRVVRHDEVIGVTAGECMYGVDLGTFELDVAPRMCALLTTLGGAELWPRAVRAVIGDFILEYVAQPLVRAEVVRWMNDGPVYINGLPAFEGDTRTANRDALAAYEQRRSAVAASPNVTIAALPINADAFAKACEQYMDRPDDFVDSGPCSTGNRVLAAMAARRAREYVIPDVMFKAGTVGDFEAMQAALRDGVTPTFGVLRADAPEAAREVNSAADRMEVAVNYWQVIAEPSVGHLMDGLCGRAAPPSPAHREVKPDAVDPPAPSIDRDGVSYGVRAGAAVILAESWQEAADMVARGTGDDVEVVLVMSGAPMFRELAATDKMDVRAVADMIDAVNRRIATSLGIPADLLWPRPAPAPWIQRGSADDVRAAVLALPHVAAVREVVTPEPGVVGVAVDLDFGRDPAPFEVEAALWRVRTAVQLAVPAGVTVRVAGLKADSVADVERRLRVTAELAARERARQLRVQTEVDPDVDNFGDEVAS